MPGKNGGLGFRDIRTANPNEGVFTMTRMIVTYFSATGTTESAAKALTRATGTELYRIEPTERHTRLGI